MKREDLARNRRMLTGALGCALYGFLVAMVLVSVFLSPHFLTSRNLYSMLLNKGHYLLIACGISVALLIGLTDLSVGSVAYLSMVFSGLTMQHTELGFAGGIVVCVLTGALAGAVNGCLMVRMKLSPLLVTLGMQLVLRGIAMMITKSMYIYMPESVYGFMTKTVFGFPAVVVFVLVFVAALHLVLELTRFGKYVYAVGCNERAARTIGVNADRTRFLGIVVCDVYAALAGFYCAANLGTIQQTIGMSWEFEAIAISVLGGVSLFGGVGRLFPGVCVGFLIIVIIENIMGLIGVSTYLIPIVNGVVIFIAMFMDSLKRKFKTFGTGKETT